MRNKKQIRWSSPEVENQLRACVKLANSISDICRKFNINTEGGNYRTVSKHLSRLGLDITHFIRHSKYNPADVTTAGKRKQLRDYLLRTQGHVCFECKRTEWGGQPIPLEMDHIDGNNFNNVVENVRMLCRNCHALTPTFGNRARDPQPKVQKQLTCEVCTSKFWRRQSSAARCCSKTCVMRRNNMLNPGRPTKVTWPSDADLRKLVWAQPATHVASTLGLSSCAIKKRCKSRGIETPARGYWQKLRAES